MQNLINRCTYQTITISTTEFIQTHNLNPPPLIHPQEKQYIKTTLNTEITMIKEEIPEYNQVFREEGAIQRR